MSQATSQAIFFHAGCPVCVAAEQQFVQALDPTDVYKRQVVRNLLTFLAATAAAVAPARP